MHRHCQKVRSPKLPFLLASQVAPEISCRHCSRLAGLTQKTWCRVGGAELTTTPQVVHKHEAPRTVRYKSVAPRALEVQKTSRTCRNQLDPEGDRRSQAATP